MAHPGDQSSPPDRCTPQEAAEVAGAGGDRVLRHLLAAAREVSVEREWDLVHALRVAGVPGV
ncbi:hypothetical protein ABZ154_30655 [Streptomyces sp. NPDC006261]|uniref:hypothetical protein n=1 Tax=Streptomyces sp. NPDC006261 TaxID=3156739 RepID=UPI0033BB6D5E